VQHVYRLRRCPGWWKTTFLCCAVWLAAGLYSPARGQSGVDEKLQSYLAEFPDSDADRNGELTRAEWLAHQAHRQKDAFIRESGGRVKLIENLIYAEVGGRPLKLDLYLPADAAGRPLVVWIHGGGWHSGTKDRCLVRWLTRENYAVASIQYRLSGQATFPAQIHDCKAAIRWLRAHAERYGYDPNRIAAAGESAGGHLAALLGTSGGVEALEGSVGMHPDQPSRVQAVIDFYGPTDFLRWTDRRAVADSVDRLLGTAAAQSPDAASLASPASHVTGDDPPILILHGSDDPLVPVDQSVHLHEICRAAGLAAQLHVVQGAQHTGPQFSDSQRQALIKAFLAEHVGAEERKTKERQR
jgi:acetyl esterase/lipase